MSDSPPAAVSRATLREMGDVAACIIRDVQTLLKLPRVATWRERLPTPAQPGAAVGPSARHRLHTTALRSAATTNADEAAEDDVAAAIDRAAAASQPQTARDAPSQPVLTRPLPVVPTLRFVRPGKTPPCDGLSPGRPSSSPVPFARDENRVRPDTPPALMTPKLGGGAQRRALSVAAAPPNLLDAAGPSSPQTAAASPARGEDALEEVAAASPVCSGADDLGPRVDEYGCRRVMLRLPCAVPDSPPVVFRS